MSKGVHVHSSIGRDVFLEVENDVGNDVEASTLNSYTYHLRGENRLIWSRQLCAVLRRSKVGRRRPRLHDVAESS